MFFSLWLWSYFDIILQILMLHMIGKKAKMIANQMRSEIRASFLHEITLSADPMFMAQQIKQR